VWPVRLVKPARRPPPTTRAGRAEWPDLTREHSRGEGNGIPHVRALLENARGKRSATHARVVLDGARRQGDQGSTRFGSPFLAWLEPGKWVLRLVAGADDGNVWVRKTRSHAVRLYSRTSPRGGRCARRLAPLVGA
jgi:hypothetical protein